MECIDPQSELNTVKPGQGNAMDDDAGKVMITRGQAVACLEILGLDGPTASAEELSRTQALGHLLFLVEATALADTDRLDQEALRDGYSTAADMLVTGSMGITGDAGALVTLQLLARVVEDRIRRTRLDLADFNPSLQDETGWGPFHAIAAALDAVLALLRRPTPPFVYDSSEQFEVQAMRDSIEAANSHFQMALSHLVHGMRAVEGLAEA